MGEGVPGTGLVDRLDDLPECGGIVIARHRIVDEEHDLQAVLDDNLLETLFNPLVPDPDDLEKILHFRREFPETVRQLVPVPLYFLFGSDGIELLVNSDFLRIDIDVIIGDERGLVRLYRTVAHIEIIVRLGLEAGFHAEFLHRFGKDLLVGFKAHVGNETALFRSEQVSGPPGIQILHGDVEAAAEKEVMTCQIIYWK